MDAAVNTIKSLTNEDFKDDEPGRLQALTDARALVKRLSKERRTAGPATEGDAISTIVNINNVTFYGNEPARLQALTEARALVKRLGKRLAPAATEVTEHAPTLAVTQEAPSAPVVTKADTPTFTNEASGFTVTKKPRSPGSNENGSIPETTMRPPATKVSKKVQSSRVTKPRGGMVLPPPPKFPIFELPAELRLVIYHHALCTERKLFITSATAPNPYGGALLQVSRQVRREALSSFYGQIFVGVIYADRPYSPSLQHVLSWLHKIGKPKCAMVKRLELRLSDTVRNLLTNPVPDDGTTYRTDGFGNIIRVPSARDFGRALFDTGIGCDRIVYALGPSDRGDFAASMGWIDELEGELRKLDGREIKLYPRTEVAAQVE